MLRTALVAAVCLLTAGACGLAKSDASSNDDDRAAGFPVTVDQAAGEVVIEDRPTKVVALDFPSADAAIALGMKPIAMVDLSYLEGGVQEWTKAGLAGFKGKEPELLKTDSGFPFEKLDRLDPDVILATNTYPLIEESWEVLNDIAPVVGHIEGPGVDTWQQGVRQVGTALGKEDRAEELIADVEGELGKVRDDHPEFADKTVSFFNYVAGDGLYVINDESDVSIKFLRELGFAGITDTVAGFDGESGRAQVSPGLYTELEADLVMGTSPDPASLDDLTNTRLFALVPAVERGSWVGLGIGPATAMAFPSVLSLPYAADELVPELASAIK